MSSEIIGAIGLVCMILLVVGRVPVALAMLGVGLVGFGAVTSPSGALQMLKDIPVDVLAKYDFSAIPLFILMGYSPLILVWRPNYSILPVLSLVVLEGALVLLALAHQVSLLLFQDPR